MLDPAYEAKSKKLDEFRNKLFQWSLEFFVSRYFLFQVAIWTPLVLFIWKVNILFLLVVPAIFIMSGILTSIPMYLTFRKELKIDD